MDFLYRLTDEGGPKPRAELDDLMMRASEHPQGHAWFASRYRGADFDLIPGSRALIFYVEEGLVHGVLAGVLLKAARLPPGPAIRIYAGHEFTGWWNLTRPRPLVPGLTLAAVPGRSLSGGGTARTTFEGAQTWVARWDLGQDAEETLVGPP